VIKRSIELHCTNCKYDMIYEGGKTTCPRCGETILEARYNLDALRSSNQIDEILRRKPGVWRYFEMLPLLDRSNIVTMGEGGTPMFKALNLGVMLGLRYLYI